MTSSLSESSRTSPPPDTSPSAAPAAPPGPGLAALLSGVGIVVLAVILIAVNLPGSDKPHGPHYPYPDSGPTATLAFPAKAKGADGLAFSPDGRTLATGSEDGEVRLWDVTRRKVRASLKQSDSIGNEFGSRSVAFSPDGKLLATGLDNGAMAVWDVAGRRRLRQLDQAGEHVEFSPDGKLLATGSESGPVLLWDPHKHTNDADDIEAYFDGHMDVTSLAFSPDGRTLAAGGDDSGSNLTPIDAALLWDVAGRKPGAYGQGDPRATLEHGGPVLSVAYSPDGKTLATGGRDGRVRLWDTASRRPKATFTADGSGNPDPYTYVPPVSDLAFSPDGRTLAATTDNGVMLWNPATRKPRAILTSSTKGDGDKIGNVAFSSDGRLVAGNGTKSHTVLLWKNPAWKNPS